MIVVTFIKNYIRFIPRILISLTNRLKIILPTIISENQSAFMANRLITDNILVAFEVMNHISQRKGSLKGEMALKLDLSKAYDRVEWGGFGANYENNGFPSKMG